MKAAFESDLKSETFSISKSYFRLADKEVIIFNFKFYQKLIVFLIAFSIFLIFPESPKELENIYQIYNSRKICNVW